MTNHSTQPGPPLTPQEEAYKQVMATYNTKPPKRVESVSVEIPEIVGSPDPNIKWPLGEKPDPQTAQARSDRRERGTGLAICVGLCTAFWLAVFFIVIPWVASW